MHTRTSPIVKSIIGYSAALVLVVGTIGSAALAQPYGVDNRDHRHEQERQMQREQGREREREHEREAARFGRGAMTPKLTSAQAISIALNHFPGRIVGPTRLVRVGDRLAYQVNVRRGDTLRTVTINANNGRILYSTETRLPMRGMHAHQRF